MPETFAPAPQTPPAAAPAPAPAPAPVSGPSAPGRLQSLDVFRGITVAGMLLVNNPGTWSAIYPPLAHAEWHGWTPTDLIFPFFLFIVGVAIVGLTFSLFIRDNIKQFGALKAIGVTNGKIRGMVALQAGWIGFIGYGIGIGLAAAFIYSGGSNSDTFKGFYTPWQVLVGVGVAVLLMVFATGFLALRKVLKTEPAEVFR